MTQKEQNPVVLLIAGSRASLKLVGKHLAPYFDVSTAADAESAWEILLGSRDISLIISELELAIDQYGLLERLRSAADSRLAATPLLLLVGENDHDDRRETAFQAGATDFINMPFASTELSARARLHANLYQQQQQSAPQDMQSVTAVNLLQQLSQQKFFISRVQQELSFSLRHRSNISLCKLKLDNIKAIAAAFDKATAISAVRVIATIIQQTLRREDSLCYLGNAEFCLLYPATNGIGAIAAVNRIVGQISGNKIAIAGKKVPVTLSGAVYSCIATEEIDFDKIITKLDAGLAEAQAGGGNQIVSSSSPENRMFSIDRALKLLESGQVEDLSAHAAELILTVLPLLEFADGVLQLDLESINQRLREQLESGSGSSA